MKKHQPDLLGSLDHELESTQHKDLKEEIKSEKSSRLPQSLNEKNNEIVVKDKKYLKKDELFWVKKTDLSPRESLSIVEEKGPFCLIEKKHLESIRGLKVLQNFETNNYAIVTGVMKVRGYSEEEKQNLLNSGRYEIHEEYPHLQLLLLTAKDPSQFWDDFDQLSTQVSSGAELEVIETLRQTR
jgi:hypothetical protein